MSFAEKKGIAVASGFKLQAEAPIDARFVAATIAERDELITIKAGYEGLEVYVKETKKRYTWDGAQWLEGTTGAAYVHPTAPGYRHIPAGGTVGQILRNTASGEAEWADERNYDTELSQKVPVSRKVNGKALNVDINLSAADVGAVSVSQKGSAGGVAELDESGKVPAAQLPSYVDDVVEGYLSGGKLYEEESHTTEIPGESGKIYVDVATGKTYRWSGTAYAEISASLALGETSTTAFRGDHGKAAYDHSQTDHAPADAQKNVQGDWNETDTSSDAYIKNKPKALPAQGGDADTVGGHKVESDVPTGAVFTDTKPEVMTGATAEAAGKAGYVPAPQVEDQGKVLYGDGTWKTPKTYGDATQTAPGLMSAADKQKLDNLPQMYFGSELPENAPTGSVCFLVS